MLTLIKNAQIYSPESLGICDVLISGKKIVQIEKNIDISGNINIDVIDAQGQLLIPGLVDTLVHITGGGGEGGFSTRTAELSIYDAIKGGVTTMVGALGTDASTRSIGELYGKAKALTEDGLSCYMYTGSYEIPVKTITGSVRNDIIFVEPVIGIGEIAIADHRGSQPTVSELARIASDARVGGMLSGKSGVVSVHVGGAEECLELLFKVARDSAVPLAQFYPTHMSRNSNLFDAGIEFALQGGTIDFTASTTDHILAMGEIRASKAFAMALNRGLQSNKITISSDAQGSLPHFDDEGVLDGLEVGRIGSLFEEFALCVKDENIPLEIALEAVTKNPASICGLINKGQIKVGGDADLNLLIPGDLTITSVMSKGVWMMKGGRVCTKTIFDH